MRALLLVLDGVGIGNAPDADKYGDRGANTLGHIFEHCPDLSLPNLDSLGLGGLLTRGRHAEARPSGGTCFRMSSLASYGRMRELSVGKDTTTGHWELAGAILEKPFAVYEQFPPALVQRIEKEADVHFIGNYARSGTAILEELGHEHLRTGNAILYTSADSVMQIAAHEEIIPIERLYEICQVARKHADGAQIGRVIARPFTGEDGKFVRTERRHDYSMKPPRTILNAINGRGIPVIGVGKISDIFAGEGISESFPTSGNAEGMARINELTQRSGDSFIFANLVDFDMLYGHRRNVAGYADALKEFDHWLGDFLGNISPDDLLIITADHGNDPTFRGTDHTREEVPLFVLRGEESRDLATRETFADVAASLAEYFALEPWPVGSSFLHRSRV